jgi:hypothetical protein
MRSRSLAVAIAIAALVISTRANNGNPAVPQPAGQSGVVFTTVGEVIRDHPVVHGVIAKATGRACEEEDSVNCFWNARTMGNGRGHSFYSVRVGHQVCHIYWSTTYNRRHGGCAR